MKNLIHINKRKCRVCGCTNDDCRQCIEKQGHACYWTEADLCSACMPEVKHSKMNAPKPRKSLSSQAPTIESMVEHLEIKDKWYQSFIREENFNTGKTV